MSFGRVAAPVWDPRMMGGLMSYYHADDSIGSQWSPSSADSGNAACAIARIADNGPMQQQLMGASNANSPLYNPTVFGGRGGWTFDGTRGSYFGDILSANFGNYNSIPANSWRYLHDGTGCTFVAYVMPMNGSATKCLVASTTNSTAGCGIVIWHDATTDKFNVEVRNLAGTVILTFAANVTSAKNVPHVIVFRFLKGGAGQDADLWVDGVQVATGNTTGTPGAGPSGAGLCIGRYQGFTGSFEGAMRVVMTFNRSISDNEVKQLFALVPQLGSPRRLRKVLTVGDSITAACLYQQQLWIRSLYDIRYSIAFLGTAYVGAISWFVDRQTTALVGATISGIQGIVSGTTYAAGNPTDVIVQAGTNNAGGDIPTCTNQFDSLISLIKSQYPGATVWIAKLPRRFDNAGNRTWTESWRAVQESYAFANGCQVLNHDPGADNLIGGDGVHPNTAGYKQIGDQDADVWGFPPRFGSMPLLTPRPYEVIKYGTPSSSVGRGGGTILGQVA